MIRDSLEIDRRTEDVFAYLFAPLARRAARVSVTDIQRQFETALEPREAHPGPMSEQERAHATRG